MTEATAFIDTNIFLHYQPFYQIRWERELKCDRVTLVLSQVVVHELDRKKDEHQNDRIRNRARTILSKLHEVIEAGGTVDVHVELQFEETPPAVDYAELRLDRSRNDDQIIASVYAFRTLHPEERVLIVTNDTGLMLKCRVHGIAVVRLRQSLYVAGETDPHRQRIKELEAENSALKRVHPELGLAFRGGGDRLRFTVEPEVPVSAESAKAWLEAEVIPRVQKPVPVPASTIEKLKGQGPDLDVTSWAQLFAAFAVTWNQQQHHSIEQFYSQCIRYYMAWTEYQNAERRTCRLTLSVENSGSAVAEDVYLFLTLPTGVEVFANGQTTAAPKPPEPAGVKLLHAPQKLQSGHETMVLRPSTAKLISNVALGSHRELCYHIPRVQHHVGEWLQAIGIRFPSHWTASTIAIPYRLTAANAPEPVFGELAVDVVVPTRTPRKIARRG